MTERIERPQLIELISGRGNDERLAFFFSLSVSFKIFTMNKYSFISSQSTHLIFC